MRKIIEILEEIMAVTYKLSDILFFKYDIQFIDLWKGRLWEVIIRNARIAAEQWKKGVYLPEDLHLSGRVIMRTEAV